MVYCVTGAAGHLGSHVVKALVERGDRVRALVLPGERCPDFISRRERLEEIEGDVRDAASLDRLMEGSGGKTVVVHCAGIVEITGKSNRRLFDINVGGTKNVLSACARNGARRLVYVSSVHAIPILPRGQVMREINAFSPDGVSGPYDKSKAEATRLVLDAAKIGLDAVCVHPAGIIGPHGNPAVGAARLITACLKGTLAAAVRGGFDFVDVRDVADGILAAADVGRTGACYILSNRFVSFRELLDTLTGVAGLRRVRLFLPAWVALAVAPLAEAYYRLMKKAPLFTRYALRTATRNALYSHEKATRELGYTTRSLTRTMIDIVAASGLYQSKTFFRRRGGSFCPWRCRSPLEIALLFLRFGSWPRTKISRRFGRNNIRIGIKAQASRAAAGIKALKIRDAVFQRFICAAWYIAIRFSGGTFATTLWVGLKT